jgi:hypothetical protein
MSDLEKKSKRLVTELLTDKRTTPLSHVEQIKLSVWIYKTAIMLALAYPAADRFVLADDYHYFYEHRKPPNGTGIWIAAAAHVGSNEMQVGWTRPERLDFSRADGTALDPHGYRLSFSVVSLICQVMRDPHGGNFARPRAFRDVWIRIRPVSKGTWPPGRRISSAALEDVAGGRIFSGAEPP